MLWVAGRLLPAVGAANGSLVAADAALFLLHHCGLGPPDPMLGASMVLS